MTTTAALIVAAGRGTRAGGGLPKQWRPLAGQRVIDHVVDAFAGCGRIDRICIVVHPDDVDRADGFRQAGHMVVTGAGTRSGSVRASGFRGACAGIRPPGIEAGWLDPCLVVSPSLHNLKQNLVWENYTR